MGITHNDIEHIFKDTRNESGGDGCILSSYCDPDVFPVIPNILMPFPLACAVRNDSENLPYVVKTHIHIVICNNIAVYFFWHFQECVGNIFP